MTQYFCNSCFQESNNEDDEIDPVSLFSSKTTSPSLELKPCNNLMYNELSPKKAKNNDRLITDAPDDSEYNDAPRKPRMTSGDLEYNRKSFSIDRLLFSSKQRHHKMPLLSPNNTDCQEEKSKK